MFQFTVGLQSVEDDTADSTPNEVYRGTSSPHQIPQTR